MSTKLSFRKDSKPQEEHYHLSGVVIISKGETNMEEDLPPHRVQIRPCWMWMVEIQKIRARNLGLGSRRHPIWVVVKLLGMSITGSVSYGPHPVSEARAHQGERSPFLSARTCNGVVLFDAFFLVGFQHFAYHVPRNGFIYINHLCDSLRYLGIKVSISVEFCLFVLFFSNTWFHCLCSY